ncbi:hypothetical protein ACFLWC_00530 [Chloroflexota bacterium]
MAASCYIITCRIREILLKDYTSETFIAEPSALHRTIPEPMLQGLIGWKGNRQTMEPIDHCRKSKLAQSYSDWFSPQQIGKTKE